MKETFLEVIQILIRFQPLTINQLTGKIGKNQSTISRRVQKMEGLGYVKSFGKASEDNRETILFLNPENIEVQKYLPGNFKVPERYKELLEQEKPKLVSDYVGSTSKIRDQPESSKELEELRKLTTLLADYYTKSANYLDALKPFVDSEKITKEKFFEILAKALDRFQSQYRDDLESLDEQVVFDYIDMENN